MEVLNKMDKESIYELQKIDCNCNNCKYMIRDSDRFKKSLEFHRKLQLDEYEKRQKKDPNRKEFQFDKSAASINYGNCTKFNKPVSFIPDTCQIDTQECFKHRKD